MEGDRMKYDLARASIEARQCQDLLSQASYHVARARKIDEEERAQRRKQQEEREKFRLKQLTMQKQLEEERKAKLEELARAREEYKEKMKNATVIEEAALATVEKVKKGNWKSTFASRVETEMLPLNMVFCR